MKDMLIDVTRLLGRFFKGRLPTGVDRVSQAYIRHFSGRGRALVRTGSRSMVLPKPASRQLFDALLDPASGFKQKALWTAGRHLPLILGSRRFDGSFLFNTGHSGLEHAAYPALLQHLRVRPLFLVHDLIPITHPEYCRQGERDRHRVRMNTVLQSAAGVITNSQVTLDELTRYAAKTGQRMPPAVAAPLAATGFPAPSVTAPLTGPYFVTLGTIEPRKNHGLLLQLWRTLINRMGKRAPKLLVIGQRGWECENVVDLLERCDVLRGMVIEVPSCSDADLATYLAHAQALLFPSFAEGYGIPLVEALSLGVPVIASDLPVFREIADKVPDYLDPLDGMGWLGCIEAYCDPASPMRAAQVSRIADFSTPQWQTHFHMVEEFLERLG